MNSGRGVYRPALPRPPERPRELAGLHVDWPRDLLGTPVTPLAQEIAIGLSQGGKPRTARAFREGTKGPPGGARAGNQRATHSGRPESWRPRDEIAGQEAFGYGRERLRRRRGRAPTPVLKQNFSRNQQPPRRRPRTRMRRAHSNPSLDQVCAVSRSERVELQARETVFPWRWIIQRRVSRRTIDRVCPSCVPRCTPELA